MLEEDCKNLESQSQKCICLGIEPDGSFGYQLRDLENQQFVRSVDVVFNKTGIPTIAEHPIEILTIMFGDATPPSNKPVMHKRTTLWPVASMAPSPVLVSNLKDLVLARHESISTATSATLAYINELRLHYSLSSQIRQTNSAT